MGGCCPLALDIRVKAASGVKTPCRVLRLWFHIPQHEKGIYVHLISSPNNDVWKLVIDSRLRIEVSTPPDWRSEPDDQTVLSLRAPGDVLTSLRLQYVSRNRLRFNDRVTQLCDSEASYWQQQKIVPIEVADQQAFEAHFLLEAPAVNCLLKKVYVSAGAGIFVVVFMTRAESWARNNPLYRRIIKSIDVSQNAEESLIQATARCHSAGLSFA